MTDAAAFMHDAGRKRRGGRAARQRALQARAVHHRPGLVRNLPVTELLTEEGTELIHDAALRVIEEIGVEFRDDAALELWRRAGARVEGPRVRASRELVMALVGTAPREFVHHARNPDRSVAVGGRNMVFAPSYGMPFVRDLDGTRRNARLEDLHKVQKLTHMAPAVHITGGPIVEPTDIPVQHRHLHMVASSLLYSDKPIIGAVTSGARARDTLAMAEIVFGAEFVAANAVTTSLINSTSPLVWDGTMLQALMTYAQANQAVICAPFSMAGASTPASPFGTMVVVSAENLMAIGLTQLVNPGAPAIFGCPAMTVDLRTGAPVFGCPDSALIQLLAGMMARRYAVPHRAIVNCATSKTPDIYAGYDSMWGAFSAIMAGANWISHAGGVLDNTMTLCFAKLVLDHEQIDGFFHFTRGVAVEDADALIEVIREVGPGGHFLGSAHTRNSNLFELRLQDTSPYEQWVEEGRRDAADRANAEAGELLQRYERPALEAGIEENLRDFIARRTGELPADVPE